MSPLLKTSVQRAGRAHLIALPAVLAVVCALALGLNLWIGEDQLPRELVGSTPWFGLGTLLFGALTGWVWWRGRIALQVVEHEGARYLEVYDAREPLVLRAPLQVRRWVTRQHIDRGVAVTLLVARFYEEGRCRLELSETWGMAYAPPEDWTPGDPSTEQVEAAYEAAARSFLPKLVALVEADGVAGAQRPTG